MNNVDLNLGGKKGPQTGPSPHAGKGRGGGRFPAWAGFPAITRPGMAGLLLLMLFCVAMTGPEHLFRACEAIAQDVSQLILPLAQAAEGVALQLADWLGRRELIVNLLGVAIFVLVVRELLSSHRLFRLLILTAACLGAVFLDTWLLLPAAERISAQSDRGRSLILVAILAFLGLMGVLLCKIVLHYLNGAAGNPFEKMFHSHGGDGFVGILRNLAILAAVAGLVTLLLRTELKPEAASGGNVWDALAGYVLVHPGKTAALLLPLLLTALIITLVHWKSDRRCVLLTFLTFCELLLMEASVVGAEKLVFCTGFPVADILLNLISAVVVILAICGLLSLLLSVLVEGHFPNLLESWSSGKDADSEDRILGRIRRTLRAAGDEVGRTIVSVAGALWVMFFTADIADGEEGHSGFSSRSADRDDGAHPTAVKTRVEDNEVETRNIRDKVSSPSKRGFPLEALDKLNHRVKEEA